MQRLVFSAILAFHVLYITAQESDLMPWPAQVEFHDNSFALKGRICSIYRNEVGLRVIEAFDRLRGRLSRLSGVAHLGDGECNGVVVFNVQRTITLSMDVDESYELRVTRDTVFVASNTDIGAVRAMSTLYQLAERDGIDFNIRGADIKDEPRFPWRGLLVDVCRHFIPREGIIRQLDGLELVKMNVLHLHLTEDQAFRIESKVFPELSEAGSNGQFLTQADIKEIIDEADIRGIRVIPEFDMPGHTTAWFVEHPELASAPGPYQIESGFGVFDPTMDPTKESTYEFLDRFLGEMAQLFPDEFLHIGGDENNGKHWTANERIIEFMNREGIADNHALQAYFNKRLSKILTKHGKRMVGWDEILAEELPSDILIQSWRGKEGLVKAAQSGREAILSNGWYIDLCRTAAEHYLNDPVTEEMGLSDDESEFVLGGEATMWAELVDQHNIDTRIWPRTAAIAERLWSPKNINDVADMYRRLNGVSLRLDAAGLKHKSAQMDLMRLMAQSTEVSGLKKRVDVIAPVKDYQRHRLVEHTTYTPLTNLADIAVPDPEYVRYVDGLITEHFTKRTKLTESALLAEFRLLRKELKPTNKNAHLPDIPYIQELLDFATDAVHVVNGSSNWDEAQINRLNELKQLARTPFAECQLALLDPLNRLFTVAIENSK